MVRRSSLRSTWQRAAQSTRSPSWPCPGQPRTQDRTDRYSVGSHVRDADEDRLEPLGAGTPVEPVGPAPAHQAHLARLTQNQIQTPL